MATVRRPLGVTLAAVAAILGSIIFVLLGLLMLVGAFAPTPQAAIQPSFLKVVSIVMCAVMLGFAAWGFATSVGLLRLRNWARWSILIFSALLTLIGGASALTISLVPMPPSPQVSEQVANGIRFGIAVFYGVLAVMGALWLYYFNTARVRATFAAEAKADVTAGRPLSVSVIAWMMLLGGLFCFAGAFSRFPALMFGFAFTGSAARAFYLGFAAIQASLGAGLLRLNPLSRVLAIAMFVAGILNSVLSAVVPGNAERMRAVLDAMPFTTPMPAGYDPLPPITVSLIMGSVASAIPIWFLVTRRQAFVKPPALPPL